MKSTGKTLESISIQLINDGELLKLFNELNTTIQSKIIQEALRNSGKQFIPVIKSQFFSTKKNKSKTNYSDFNKSFKVENRRKTQDLIGVKIGMQHQEGYKYRFLNWGTEERATKKDFYRGKIEGSNFFYKAVEQNKESVQQQVSQEIIKSLERVVKKYS